MIVAILDSRIGPVVVVVIIAAHRGLIVVMLLCVLIVMILRMVLCADRQRDDRTQRERRHGEDKRLPSLMTHGVLTFSCRGGRL